MELKKFCEKIIFFVEATDFELQLMQYLCRKGDYYEKNVVWEGNGGGYAFKANETNFSLATYKINDCVVGFYHSLSNVTNYSDIDNQIKNNSCYELSNGFGVIYKSSNFSTVINLIERIKKFEIVLLRKPG